MLNRPKVLITGSAGRIGEVLSEGLAESYALRGYDRVPTRGLREHVVGDLADFDALRRAADGMDALIHLGGNPAPEASWKQLLPNNIIGTYHAYEAARQAGVRRFIYASRAGLVAEYPDHLTRTVDFKPCPTSLYSATKCFGESLGYHYSVSHGMEVVSVRIGNYAGEREVAVHPHQIGKEDLINVFDRALRQRKVRFEIVFAVSDSTFPMYDLDHGRKAIGYYPKQKSSWSRFRLVRVLRKIWKS